MTTVPIVEGWNLPRSTQIPRFISCVESGLNIGEFWIPLSSKQPTMDSFQHQFSSIREFQNIIHWWARFNPYKQEDIMIFVALMVQTEQQCLNTVHILMIQSHKWQTSSWKRVFLYKICHDDTGWVLFIIIGYKHEWGWLHPLEYWLNTCRNNHWSVHLLKQVVNISVDISTIIDGRTML